MNPSDAPGPGSPYPVKKGQTLSLTVDRLAFGGKGVARVDGYTVFVVGGLPGQEVEATITRRKRSFAEARLERVLTPSPDQVDPRCADFGVCGGCALQHYDYEAQGRAKREQVRECLTRIAGLPDLEVEPTQGSPAAFEYRNKMEFSFSPTRWLTADEVNLEEEVTDRFGLGLHVRRRFDRVVNVERCHLMPPEATAIMDLVRDVARNSGLPPYSTRTHSGFWRFLVVREGTNTGDRMVHLITHEAPPGSREQQAVEQVAEALRAHGPRITSLIHGVSTRKASVAFCEEPVVLAGEPVIRDRLLDLTFEIGPNTFFQTNTRGAEGLFRSAVERAGFSPEDTVWDLYCGAGALTLPLARRTKRVLGLELVPEAVEAARRNAELNGITNVEFRTGDIRALLADPSLAQAIPPDAVAVDPPRDGLHADVAAALIALAPPRILYISCNPSTLARDIAIFVEGGYTAGPVLPVDMFPHTAHVECVTTLTREDAGSG